MINYQPRGPYRGYRGRYTCHRTRNRIHHLKNPLKPPNLDNIPSAYGYNGMGREKGPGSSRIFGHRLCININGKRMFDLLDKGTDKEYPSNADISSIDQNEIQNEDHWYIEGPDETMIEGDQNNELFAIRVSYAKISRMEQDDHTTHTPNSRASWAHLMEMLKRGTILNTAPD